LYFLPFKKIKIIRKIPRFLKAIGIFACFFSFIVKLKGMVLADFSYDAHIREKSYFYFLIIFNEIFYWFFGILIFIFIDNFFNVDFLLVLFF